MRYSVALILTAALGLAAAPCSVLAAQVIFEATTMRVVKVDGTTFTPIDENAGGVLVLEVAPVPFDINGTRVKYNNANAAITARANFCTR